MDIQLGPNSFVGYAADPLQKLAGITGEANHGQSGHPAPISNKTHNEQHGRSSSLQLYKVQSTNVFVQIRGRPGDAKAV